MSKEWKRVGRRTRKGDEIYQNVMTGELAFEFDNRYLVPYREEKKL